MEEIANLAHGFSVALTLPNLGFMLIGITLGVLIGVLPGLGGANGIAILLPLTFSMNPTSAIIMLSCIYWGALFGGAITSILFNIPGEPWSVATTFDGYPLAQNGRAGAALTAAFTSSFVGALLAVILITFLSPIVAGFALRFGPPEFFSVYLLTFCAFVGMSKGSAFKTIAAMMMGFALIMVQVRSPMLFSVGMYLPLETTFAIFVGGVIRWMTDTIRDRRGFNEAQKARIENAGVLTASGLIAGEALMGLVKAGFSAAEKRLPEIFAAPPLFMSALALAILTIVLIRVPLANAGSPDEPAPPTAIM